MALNAAASSADSRSSPPVARASVSPASSLRAAAATSRSGRVSRPARTVEMSTMTMRLAMPATTRVRLNSGRKPRSVPDPGERRLEGRDGGAIDHDRGDVGRDITLRRIPECCQRRVAGGHDLDLATEVQGQPADGGGDPGGAIEAVGKRHRGVVQPLFLLRRDDRLESLADHAIHDDADDEEHAQDRDAHDEAQAPGERASGHGAGSASRTAMSRYPVWGIVSMSHGSTGSSRPCVADLRRGRRRRDRRLRPDAE